MTMHNSDDEFLQEQPSSASSQVTWEEAIILLANLYRRMNESIPAIYRDISIPRDHRRAAIQNIRGEMKGINKGIEACRRMLTTTGMITQIQASGQEGTGVGATIPQADPSNS